MGKQKFTAICHTKCYWGETLWHIGEIYEGNMPIPPPADRWFSADGTTDNPEPPPIAGLDPRTNDELRVALKRQKAMGETCGHGKGSCKGPGDS